VLGVRFLCCFHISSITFSATGIIMPVVAVLLSHIDRNHDGSMKPISSLRIYTQRPLTGGSGKNIWRGAWPLIIWEATTAKRNYYRTNYINQQQNCCVQLSSINLGGQGKIWGAGCASGPSIEPPLRSLLSEVPCAPRGAVRCVAVPQRIRNAYGNATA